MEQIPPNGNNNKNPLDMNIKDEVEEKSTKDYIGENAYKNDFSTSIDFTSFCSNFSQQLETDKNGKTTKCNCEVELKHQPVNKCCDIAGGSQNGNKQSVIVQKKRKPNKCKRIAMRKEIEHEHEPEPDKTSGQSSNLEEGVEEDKLADLFLKFNVSSCNLESTPNMNGFTKKGSILKKNRSYSESSSDELWINSKRSLSVNDMDFSVELHNSDCTGPKKTVRFNDVISKKLYSSDISIVAQGRRTQRRNKRRERRASESDNSETEADYASNKQGIIRFYNEQLYSGDSCSENETTSSISESGDEVSDDQRNENKWHKTPPMTCSKKVHKKRGKKSVRKTASTAKYQFANTLVY